MVGHTAPAFLDLKAPAQSADPFVKYLANLMLGLLYERTGERDAAIARYSTAADVLPASAASLALSAALYRDRRVQEASEIVSAWARHTRIDDPWRLYGLGLYHQLPQHIAAMRARMR